MTTNLQLLRHAYMSETGNRADFRWAEVTVAEKLQEHRAAEQRRIAERQKREAAEEQRRAEREARIAARGDIKAFSENRFRMADGDPTEAKLAFLARHYLDADEKAVKTLAEFAERIAADPVYAMSWSRGAFEAAASREVAEAFKAGFESGMAFDDWLAHVHKEVRRRASNVTTRSTSPTSNMMDDYLLAAWGVAAQKLDY